MTDLDLRFVCALALFAQLLTATCQGAAKALGFNVRLSHALVVQLVVGAGSVLASAGAKVVLSPSDEEAGQESGAAVSPGQSQSSTGQPSYQGENRHEVDPLHQATQRIFGSDGSPTLSAVLATSHLRGQPITPELLEAATRLIEAERGGGLLDQPIPSPYYAAPAPAGDPDEQQPSEEEVIDVSIPTDDAWAEPNDPQIATDDSDDLPEHFAAIGF